MPPSKELECRAKVARAFNIQPVDVEQEHLDLAVSFSAGPPPSELICSAACQTSETLRAFLRQWLELFVNELKPKYLAEGWALDTGLDGRFVPSVASSLLWPGDWTCAKCGVHCFARSDRCRCCQSAREDVTKENTNQDCTDETKD